MLKSINRHRQHTVVENFMVNLDFYNGNSALNFHTKYQIKNALITILTVFFYISK